jgi:nucleotide-binding universal stress UspA family protein
MFPIHTILHPTDFTERSKHAFELACALARDYGAKLVIIHAFPDPGLAAMNGAFYPVPMEVPPAELQEELDAIEPRDAAIVVERALVEGDPAAEILRAVDAHEADLIVMGTHGRGGLPRLVMGSVAEAVSRKAKCPVLTVRTKVEIPNVETPRAEAETPDEETVEIC